MCRISTVLLAGLCLPVFLLAEEIPANAEANPARNCAVNTWPARVVERRKTHGRGFHGFGTNFSGMMSGLSRTFQQLGSALSQKPATRETVAVQKQLPLAEIIDDKKVAPAAAIDKGATGPDALLRSPILTDPRRSAQGFAKE